MLVYSGGDVACRAPSTHTLDGGRYMRVVLYIVLRCSLFSVLLGACTRAACLGALRSCCMKQR